jgi:hypothetical protein
MTVKKSGGYFGNKGLPAPTANGQLLVANLSSPEQATWLSTGSPILLAETVLTSSVNAISGMTNPVLTTGTQTVSFTGIPQTFKDLTVSITQISHNEANGNGRYIRMNINGDTTNNRYYVRTGIQATGGANSNQDNIDSFQFGPFYDNTQTSWPGMVEFTFPQYSTTLPTNFRQGMGMYWCMNAFTYPMPVGLFYYNNVAATLPITSLNFSWNVAAFRAPTRIAIFGS